LLASIIALSAFLDYLLQWAGFNSLKNAWEFVIYKKWYWLGITILPISIFLFYLNIEQLFFLIHLTIIAVLYGFGTKFYFLQLPPLRNINYLKIFLIVYVWVATTVWLPFIGSDIDVTSLWIESFHRGLFYLALTLPFDIRDEKTDKKQQLKTLANQLGIFNTKILSILFLLLSLTIAFFYYSLPIFYAVAGSHLICCFLIVMVKKTRPMLYYTGLMDGTIIIQLCLLLVVQK